MGRVTKMTGLVVWCLSISTLAFAQASIVGVVRDTSGAVLPGVTVEAASPALIEKVRTVVTDGTGQYRVIDLRPGLYTVTFMLPGFNTVKREGVELGGSFTATINAELRVGALEETVTVTGESPTVDVQNTRQGQTLDRDLIAAIPSGRTTFQSLVSLIPAIQTPTGVQQDVGGDRGAAASLKNYAVHGGFSSDSRILVEGLQVGTLGSSGASISYYLPPVGTSQEIVVTTSGAMADVETGGVVVNVIPREGGSTFHGLVFATGANESMQGRNYTQALKDRGLSAPNRLAKVWELTSGVGGRLATDRLWYFLSGQYNEADNYVAGMYPNLNAGNPNAWTYAPDLSRQVINAVNAWSAALRLTWQATPRNKVNLFWDEQYRCASCPGGSATASPEASKQSNGNPNRVQQVTWSSPLTNRILFDAGFGTYLVRLNYGIGPPMVTNLTRVTEQAGTIPGLTYRAADLENRWNASYNGRASASYVTGAHAAKVGYQGILYHTRAGAYSLSGGLSYRFNNGVPNQLTQLIDAFASTHLKVHALYAQDQWTLHRLTVQGGLRYDHFGSYFPDQQVGPSNFLPVPIVFPGHGGVNFNDITPRLGVAYDLFGTGKTALKVNLSKYVVGQDSSSAGGGGNTQATLLTPGIFGTFVGPIPRLATSTTRSWNDANRDYVPNCDLASPAANGECGAMANQKFGRNVFSVAYDPEVTNGWGVRPYSWTFSASVQQELLSRVAVDVGYFRRWFGNFAVNDNLATTAADYTLFNLPVPVDARLPNSGQVVTGVVDVNPAKFGQVNEFVTAVSHYGKRIHRWHGVDANLTVRPQNGVFFQGGVSIGRTLTDNCEVAAKLPETLFGSNTRFAWTPLQYCRVEEPFLTQIKALGGYTLPRVDVQLSGTFQNIPGPPLQATWNAPNAVVAPVLGRNLSGNAANLPAALLPPLSIFRDRITQVDVRVAKILTFGRTRTQIALDLFNALNSSGIQTLNATFGPRWQTPTSIISARLAKVTLQVDF